MNPSYYAIIPADVRYAKIKPHAKLLYGEITALSNKEGYCFASNKYFANLYGVTKNTISLWIKQLALNNFITYTIIKKDNQIVQRRITIIKKDGRGDVINDDYNIMKDNTTINKSIKIAPLDFRRMKFGTEVSDMSSEINMTVEESNKFLNYWTEENRSGTKMRYELEKTWSLKSRLLRWNNNTRFQTDSKKSKVRKQFESFNKAKELINQINNK